MTREEILNHVTGIRDSFDDKDIRPVFMSLIKESEWTDDEFNFTQSEAMRLGMEVTRLGPGHLRFKTK